MKINKSKSSKKIITSIILLTLVILLALTAFTLLSKNSNKNTPAKAVTTPTSVDTSRPPKTSTAPTPGVSTDTTTNQVPISKVTSLSITELSQQNHTVTYTASIVNPGPDGTCSAVFTNDISKPVTNTTQTTTSQCGPVSIPDNQFDALGTWKLTLRYYTEDTQAVDTKTLEIQ